LGLIFSTFLIFKNYFTNGLYTCIENINQTTDSQPSKKEFHLTALINNIIFFFKLALELPLSMNMMKKD